MFNFLKRGPAKLPPGLLHNKTYFDREIQAEPFCLGSELCRVDHFLTPYYVFWCERFRQKPWFRRKQWEFVYICQSLYERGFLKPGVRALGFGVGTEPLPDLFASFGVSVTATDLDFDLSARQGWQQSGDLAVSKEDLRHGIAEPEIFEKNVTYTRVDMNNIPSRLTGFDFNWSACSLEHLGSIKHGSQFLKENLKTLRPGGLAIHTTEFNLSSNEETFESATLSVFRKRDILEIVQELRDSGCHVAPLNFYAGSHELDQYVDLPPYSKDPHLRLQLGKFKCTSIGLIIQNHY